MAISSPISWRVRSHLRHVAGRPTPSFVRTCESNAGPILPSVRRRTAFVIPTQDARPDVGKREKISHSAASASSCSGALCASVKTLRSPNAERGSAADSRRASRKGAPCSASALRRRIASGRVACHLRRIRPNSSGLASRCAASQACQSSPYRTANPFTAARTCLGVLFLIASTGTGVPRRGTLAVSSRGERMRASGLLQRDVRRHRVQPLNLARRIDPTASPDRGTASRRRLASPREP